MGTNMIMGVVTGSVISGSMSDKPTISGEVDSLITDTGFTVSADILSNSEDTVVIIQYGLTTEMTSTQAVVTGSPVAGSTTSVVSVSAILTDLLPYKRYFWRVVASNSIGVTTGTTWNTVTLEPVELTDGNWVAQYDAEYEKNVINASNQLAELRDKQFDCALSEELNPQPLFDATTGWTTGAGINISGGSLNYVNVAANIDAFFTIPIVHRKTGPFRVVVTDVTGIVGDIFVRPGSNAGVAWSAGLADIRFSDGSTSKDVTCFSMNGILYVRATTIGTYGYFPNLSIKRILGCHAVFNIGPFLPTKLSTNNYFSCDGVNDRIRAFHITSIGTVYAFARRNGTDADFLMLNALTGIADYVTTTLTIGSNNANSVFYNVDIKKLWLRTITDNAGTIAKLNEWFVRESYEIPQIEGILGSGYWNDTAVESDIALENDGV